MAYSTRGSRPIVVDGMSFRWRVDEVGMRAVIWHVLDAGRLTLTWHDRHYDPTPGFIARAVQVALDRGWNTHVHLNLELDDETFRQADGYSNRSRTIALPGLENLLEHEASTLHAPDAEHGLVEADAVLQLVFAPTFLPACIVTLWTEGSSGYAHLVGVHEAERLDWLIEAEPDWIRDAIVSVRSAEQAEEGRIVLDGMPTRVTIRDPAGVFTETDNSPSEGTPVRVASVATWRIAMDAFEGVEVARDIIEGLHPYVDPGTPPLSRDDERRVLRLFGAWSWPLGQVLVDALRALPGPWIVDARRVQLFAGLTVREVRQVLQKRAVPTFWVTSPEVALPWTAYGELEAAERARMLAANEAVRQAIRTFDQRWQGVATEALLSRNARRIERESADIERWLGAAWAPSATGPEAGWMHRGGQWVWSDQPRGPGLVVGEVRAWVQLEADQWVSCRLPS